MSEREMSERRKFTELASDLQKWGEELYPDRKVITKLVFLDRDTKEQKGSMEYHGSKTFRYTPKSNCCHN